MIGNIFWGQAFFSIGPDNESSFSVKTSKHQKCPSALCQPPLPIPTPQEVHLLVLDVLAASEVVPPVVEVVEEEHEGAEQVVHVDAGKVDPGGLHPAAVLQLVSRGVDR